ncbi:DUF3515 domain-containing protein [Streptomyces syringium]|uniref:DUF3515 domain-containing protein n=1 Tax=Streptomyces syringium TaxID=76729 RepID=A0ABS4Y078_9ACTN|nr:DUF3515 domain-containing protein [Streptomyces syringium]MBP2402157.1 hypothetical protein [Streptomyces syringium]
MKPFSRWLVSVPTVVVLLASAGCGADGSAHIAVPDPAPPEEQARLCRELHKKLPATVDGKERRSVSPESEFTAAWGSPPISLRCGVRRPLVVTEGYKYYRPQSPTIEINDVEWLPEEQSDGSLRLTTSKRTAWVEVTVPAKYTGPTGEFSMLVDLSDAVRKIVPFGYIQ